MSVMTNVGDDNVSDDYVSDANVSDANISDANISDDCVRGNRASERRLLQTRSNGVPAARIPCPRPSHLHVS